MLKPEESPESKFKLLIFTDGKQQETEAPGV